MYIKSFLAVLLLFFATGCAGKQTPLPTVKHVDIQKYSGVWYEIARYEQFFEKGCSDINATYSLQSDGKIGVLNQCIKDGKLDTAHGRAYATDASNTKLKVTFFWPFYGDYWILMLGKNYTYAVIGEPSREYFWILSRTKQLDDKDLQSILKNMQALGYDKDKLIWRKQE